MFDRARKSLGILAVGIGLVAVLMLSLRPGSARPQVVPARPEGEPDAVLAFSLDEKAAMDARVSRALAQGKNDPAPRDLADAPNLAAQRNPPFLEGLVQGEPGPFYSGEFIVTNLWQQQVEGGFLQVYAGALAEDRDQGALVLLFTSLDFTRGEETWHLAPDRGGALKIIGEHAGQLELKAEDGSRFLFDLRARSFVNWPKS